MSQRETLLIVLRHLGDLREKVVFVGGMVRQLLITDPGAAPARPTDDVDLIIDVESRTAMNELGQQLRDQGFLEDDSEHAPLCRWRVEEIRVDIMPLDPEIFGFSNVWYPSLLAHPQRIEGFDGEIRVPDGPHFCATKLEAFESRGDGDFYHHDLEDVLALVDGRPELQSEIERSPVSVRNFLTERIATLLGTPAFVEALPGHLEGDAVGQARLPLVRARLEAIAALPVLTEPKLGPLGTRRGQELTSTQGAKAISRAAADWAPLLSTNLSAASYDDATSTLSIQFKGGRIYDYYGVPRTLYSGLLSAASVGRYHRLWIKRSFNYRRIR